MLWTALAACGTEEAGSPVASWSGAPVLRFELAARLGGYEADGPDAWGTVTGATLIPDTDLLAVADGRAAKIHYFSRSGEHVRTVGGPGGGPGEFQALRRIRGVDGGKLCARDVVGAGVTIFDESGRLAGTAGADLDELESILPDFVSFAAGCSFVLRDQRGEMGMRDEPEGMRRDSVRFHLFGPGGERIRVLAAAADAEKWFKNRDDAWGRVDPIFGEELLAVVSGGRLWYGISDELRWQRVDLATGDVEPLHVPTARRPASTQHVEAERRRRLEGIEPRRGLAGTVADGVDLSVLFARSESVGIQEAPARARIPIYDEMLGDRSGRIWLRAFPEPEGVEARWLLLSTDGRFVGQWTLPRTTELLDASAEWMITLHEDELDAPVIEVLRRAPTGG